MIEQLILVRHGETTHNVAGITQGWNDSALSPRGETQVARLAQRLAGLGVDAIYSSPLERAMATAEPIARATGFEVTTLEGLKEMNYGGWEGRSFLDIRRDDAEGYRRWIADENAACPSGESHNDVLRRMREALDIATGGALSWSGNGSRPEAVPGGARRPVVVTHGTAIRIAATALLRIPVMAANHFAQDNASINIFVWRADRFVLKVWNDNTHCV